METKTIRRNNLRTLVECGARLGISKAKFAKAALLTPSQLSQLTNPAESKNIGDSVARRIEAGLELKRGWMDVIHDERSADVRIENILSHLQKPLLKNEQNAGLTLRNFNHDCNNSYRIELLDTEHSCGTGHMNNEYPDIIQAIEIDPEYAKNMFGRRPAANLKISTATGDSMVGTISPGELVVIDITVKCFKGDGIYAFTYGEASHIKRLQMVKDRLLVISDNSVYERWEIDSSNEEQFHIEGFIVGSWHMDYSRLG